MVPSPVRSVGTNINASKLAMAMKAESLDLAPALAYA
jgi:hypothetical protein